MLMNSDRSLIIILTFIISTVSSAELKLEPIKLKLPKPMFIGTPQNLNVIQSQFLFLNFCMAFLSKS